MCVTECNRHLKLWSIILKIQGISQNSQKFLVLYYSEGIETGDSRIYYYKIDAFEGYSSMSH